MHFDGGKMAKQNMINKLNAILETSHLLNTAHDVDYILESLLSKSIELIEGGDYGVIFLYNPVSTYLEVKSYVGFTKEVEGIQLKPGESMTGVAFANESPMFYDSSEKVTAYMSNMTPSNKHLLNLATAKKLHTLKGSIACPLIYKDECIGTIVIDNFFNHEPLQREDVSILEAISVQATIAIINARNYEKEIDTNNKLETYNRMLKEEKDKYQYSTKLHTKFTDMVLMGYSIKEIISEISTLMHCDVMLIDLFYNMRASSFIHDEFRSYLSKFEVSIREKLTKQNLTYHLFEQTGHYIHYFPILVNQEILGWLCVLSPSTEFSELNQITIEKGSTTLALELLKLNELNDMEQSFKGDFLDALLLNQNHAYLNKCAKEFNFDFNLPHQIAYIGSDTLAQRLQDEPFRKHAKRYINYYYQILDHALSLSFPGSIALIKDQFIVVIFELANGECNQKIKDFFKQFINDIDHLREQKDKMAPLYIGVSQIVTNLDDFHNAFKNAQHSLRILKKIKPSERCLFFVDLEVKQLLINNDTETLKIFLDKVLGNLLYYEKKSRDEFLETLSMYIRSNGNWTYTKENLHIHGNTLNYRLTRISELLNVNLNDYQQRLKIQIAYEIIDILSINT
jgi:sugar diacid utilization regulator